MQKEPASEQLLKVSTKIGCSLEIHRKVSQLQNWDGAVNYWVLRLIFELPAIGFGSVFP
jgi:hypothetical protein